MKNLPIRFFAVGVVTGGIVMLALLGLLQISRLRTALPPTAPPDRRPRLIALEPTTVHQAPGRTRPVATTTKGPVPATLPVEASLTATPLQLQQPPQIEIIGYSLEGRPLQVFTFGNGTQERMIVAGIHGGDEWNTVTLANQLIEHLDRNAARIPQDMKLYILPNLNPDGEARAHNKYGRLNRNGVDLNRNFPVNWKADWDRAGCWNYLPTSGGTAPGSEAETQALMDFIGAHQVQALISYHSAALGIFPGGFPWDGNASRLAQAIADVTSYRFPPLDTGCVYSGTLADYAVSEGIAAVDLELTNHIDTDFDENLRVLEALLTFVP